MNPLPSVQQLLQRWHQPSGHPHTEQVLSQLKTCRTASQGYHLYQCSDEGCGQYHYRYHSCRNRHCPQCGQFQKQQWIEDRTRELLPTHYFHVVFTLPHELNGLVLGNRKFLFNLLFEASAQTLLAFARDPKYLGATPGILSVLHTWGQQLSFHPHVHCIVSSGGLDKKVAIPQWKQSVRNSQHFMFPVKALAKVFRAKFLEGVRKGKSKEQLAIRDEDAFTQMLGEVSKKDWVVYAKKPFGGPQQVINYLGRYTHKTAISNKRLLHVDEERQQVSFSYKDYADKGQQKVMTLMASEFLRRFAQHILPRGFTRIRSYGYLANRGRSARLALITASLKLPPHPPKTSTPWQVRLLVQYGISPNQCPHCKQPSLVPIACVYKKRDDG